MTKIDKENDLTLEQATEWLQKNAWVLDVSAVARYIGMDKYNLHHAISGNRSIPKKYLPKLQKLTEEISLP